MDIFSEPRISGGTKTKVRGLLSVAYGPVESSYPPPGSGYGGQCPRGHLGALRGRGPQILITRNAGIGHPAGLVEEASGVNVHKNKPFTLLAK